MFFLLGSGGRKQLIEKRSNFKKNWTAVEELIKKMPEGWERSLLENGVLIKR